MMLAPFQLFFISKQTKVTEPSNDSDFINVHVHEKVTYKVTEECNQDDIEKKAAE